MQQLYALLHSRQSLQNKAQASRNTSAALQCQSQLICSYSRPFASFASGDECSASSHLPLLCGKFRSAWPMLQQRCCNSTLTVLSGHLSWSVPDIPWRAAEMQGPSAAAPTPMPAFPRFDATILPCLPTQSYAAALGLSSPMLWASVAVPCQSKLILLPNLCQLPQQ